MPETPETSGSPPKASPPSGSSPPASRSPAAPATETVTVTIDGKAHTVPQGDQPARGLQPGRLQRPLLLLPPGPQLAGGLPAVPGRRQGPAQAGALLLHAGGRQDGGDTPTRPGCWTSARQMLEFTLLNHPIDCPICDKAGECTLQKHYFDWDAKYARNDGIKVEKAKVVDIGQHIVLDQERCILCTRCIRVCDEVAKQPELTMAKRGDHEVLTTAPGRRLDNPYSLNTVDVCPVGALTAKDFRFAMRAWELLRHAVGVHRLRHRLQHRGPRLAQHRSTGWSRARTRGQQALDVRRGPLHLQAGAREPRWRCRCSGGVPVDWDRALEDAAKRPPAAMRARRSPQGLGVVFNAAVHQRGPDALARLAFEHLKVEPQPTWRPSDEGWADDILVSADKNPNTAGAKAIAGGRAEVGCSTSAATCKRGALTALLVLGTSGVLRQRGACGRCRSTSCETLGRAGHPPGAAGRGGPRGAAAGRLGRGRRHLHQPPGHGAAAARGVAAGGRRPAGLGHPLAPGAPAGHRRWSSTRPRRSSSRRSRSTPS